MYCSNDVEIVFHSLKTLVLLYVLLLGFRLRRGLSLSRFLLMLTLLCEVHL